MKFLLMSIEDVHSLKGLVIIKSETKTKQRGAKGSLKVR